MNLDGEKKEMGLTDFDVLVLKEIKTFKQNDGWIAPREIELSFGDGEDEEKIRISLGKLLSHKYIKGWGSPDPDGSHGVYSITPSGRDFLEQRRNATPLFKNISNSNISVSSSNVMQQIKIESDDEELKQLLVELKDAIDKKDQITIKKIFGYILDKSIDAGIAIVTSGLMK